MLPGISGLDFLKRIRAKNDRTPVLLLTALDSIEDRVTGLDTGADDYLVKPFALNELRYTYRKAWRHSRHQLISTVTDSLKEIEYEDGEFDIDDDIEAYQSGIYLSIYDSNGAQSEQTILMRLLINLLI